MNIDNKDSLNEDWTLEIYPKSKLLHFNFKELYQYKDLLLLFVRRDFVAVYKQTILGPLWFFIQPIFSALIQMVVFTKIAKIPVDGIPPILFYLGGNIMWGYFSSCLSMTSNTFSANAGIFGKVYFPRLIVPLSLVCSQLIKFGVQFVLFMSVWTYFYTTGDDLNPNMYVLLLPVLLLLMAGMGLGAGMIISALTTKYRDFTFLLGFATQLLMYATPIIYPISFVPENIKPFIKANPMSAIIETFRFAFTGSGSFSWWDLGYSGLFTLGLLFFGIIIFNKVERTFMDTV
jgi:lipopolysaccharide transport system permease protein